MADKKIRVHFIAIGGSAMHQLAIEMHLLGYDITGSDDEIYEPARTALQQYGLLPQQLGWHEGLISSELDFIILGMHARKDNPELSKALDLGVKVLSYPEFIYQHCANKKRIVVAGSHGKTTTTSILMHVLKSLDFEFDYLVGAGVEGFERNVRLSDAPIMIIEGDEYLSSPIDLQPKFLHYKPDISIITGVAWDHINVFPDFDSYVDQFRKFLDIHIPSAISYYFADDENLQMLKSQTKIKMIEYQPIAGYNEGMIDYKGISYPFPLIGSHNLQNAGGAWCVCRELGIEYSDFLASLVTFKGAKKRLQLLSQDEDSRIFLDFAHAPSKVSATTTAVKDWYPGQELIAVVELHTFSSLNKEFIPQYRNSLSAADKAVVFINKHTLKMKQMPELTEDFIKDAFNDQQLIVVFTKEALAEELASIESKSQNFLFMSSGNFGGLNILESLR